MLCPLPTGEGLNLSLTNHNPELMRHFRHLKASECVCDKLCFVGDRKMPI